MERPTKKDDQTVREYYDQLRAYWKQRYAEDYSMPMRMFCYQAKDYVDAGTEASRTVCHQVCQDANYARTNMRNLANSNLVYPEKPLRRAAAEYNQLAAIARAG